jgi:uncharacterized membrane protein YbhN (UPF0104 family)
MNPAEEHSAGELTGRRQKVLRLTGTVIALGLLSYLLSRQGWHEIWGALRQIPAWYLLAVLGITFLSRFSVAARWHLLLRSAQLDVSYYDSTRLTFAGLFASNFLPTTVGGDVVRLAGAIQLKYDAAVSAASLVVDRLIGMAGMAIAMPLGLPRFWEVFASSNGSSFLTPLALFAWLPAGLQERARRAWIRLSNALQAWIRQPRILLASFIFTLVHMLCIYTSITLLLHGMGEKMNIWLIAGLWSVVYFFTLLPVSINGYGLQEISIAYTFSHVGGISEPSALTLALLLRTLTMIASLPGAAFVPGILAAERSLQSKEPPKSEAVDPPKTQS